MGVVNSRLVLGLLFSCMLILPPASVAAEQKTVDITAATSIGYDDNVSVSSLDASSGKGDEILEIDLSAAYVVTPLDEQDIELNYDFYQGLYETLSEYNLQIHTASAFASREVKGFDVGASYLFTRTFLDNKRLFDSHTFSPSIGLGSCDVCYHRIEFSYVSKSFPNATGRSGEQQSISSDNYYMMMGGSAYLTLRLRLEDENTRSSELDYLGTYLRIGGSFPLTLKDRVFKVKPSYQRYWRDYSGVTASIDERRDDAQDRLTLEATTIISSELTAKFSYKWTSTNSNLPSVDMDESAIRFGLVANF